MPSKSVHDFLASGEFMRSAREAVREAVARQVARGIEPICIVNTEADFVGPPAPPIVISLETFRTTVK
jgi:hypothetical protein